MGDGLGRTLIMNAWYKKCVQKCSRKPWRGSPLGRPKRSWEDNIEIVPKLNLEVHGVDLTGFEYSIKFFTQLIMGNFSAYFIHGKVIPVLFQHVFSRNLIRS